MTQPCLLHTRLLKVCLTCIVGWVRPIHLRNACVVWRVYSVFRRFTLEWKTVDTQLGDCVFRWSTAVKKALVHHLALVSRHKYELKSELTLGRKLCEDVCRRGVEARRFDSAKHRQDCSLWPTSAQNLLINLLGIFFGIRDVSEWVQGVGISPSLSPLPGTQHGRP